VLKQGLFGCAVRSMLAGAFHAPTQMSATLPQSAKNFFRASASDAHRGRLRTCTTLVKLCGVRCCFSATQRAGGAPRHPGLSWPVRGQEGKVH